MNSMVTFLHNEFLERCRKNEQYSLRAFARSLSVPISSLSEIMSEKRPISKKIRDQIGLSMSLPLEEVRKFKVKEHGNKLKITEESEEGDYQQLALDSFYIISDGSHYAILQLIRTKGFKKDAGWIAKRLGIKVMQAKLALLRLKRVGIIEEQEDGTLIDVTNGSTTHLKNNFTNEELRSFQIKALEKAITSLKSVPIKYRDNTSMTLAISKEALPLAKAEITKFRRKLTKLLENYAEPDEVYQLAISFTPLTEILES
jgi:uncharacterized protein (TIGR02147 family)